MDKARSGTDWHVLSYFDILWARNKRWTSQHLKEAVMSFGV